MINQEFIDSLKEKLPVVDVTICEDDFPSSLYARYGWHVKFRNGFSLSIQIGNINYCNNKEGIPRVILEKKSCINAEIAVLDRKGNLTKISDDAWDSSDTVLGWADEKTILDIGHIASSFEFKGDRLIAIEEEL